MVGAPAAADAVFRARRLPRLRVGLHLVLVEGRPVLPPERVPGLVDDKGFLRTDLARFGFEICVRPSVRAQLRAEIEAQFEAYRQTGLALDHVNAHKHFHLHPTIAGDILAIGQRFGMCALRVPYEPASVLSAVESQATRSFVSTIVSPWVKMLARRVRRAGVRAPDFVFGLAWSGAMTTMRLRGLLQQLPEGWSEIYLHPATAGGFPGGAPSYRYADELSALIDPEVVALARRSDVALGGYSEFIPADGA